MTNKPRKVEGIKPVTSIFKSPSGDERSRLKSFLVEKGIPENLLDDEVIKKVLNLLKTKKGTINAGTVSEKLRPRRGKAEIVRYTNTIASALNEFRATAAATKSLEILSEPLDRSQSSFLPSTAVSAGGIAGLLFRQSLTGREESKEERKIKAAIAEGEGILVKAEFRERKAQIEAALELQKRLFSGFSGASGAQEETKGSDFIALLSRKGITLEDLGLNGLITNDTDIKPYHHYIVAHSIIEKMLLPKGVFVSNGQEYQITEVIPYPPETYTTPDGHEAIVYTTYPTAESREFNTTARYHDPSVIFPILIERLHGLEEVALERTFPGVKALKEEKSSRFQREEITSKLYLNKVIYLETYLRCAKPDGVQKGVYLAEEFEHLDVRKLAEKKLGRRLMPYTPSCEIDEVTAILKPDSFLLRELNNITSPEEKLAFASAIQEVRAKLGALRKGHSPNTLLSFLDAIQLDFPKAENGEEPPHYYTARKLIEKRLLGPAIMGKETIDNDDWFKFLDDNLPQEIMACERSKSNDLVDKLDLAARKALEQHFYLD